MLIFKVKQKNNIPYKRPRTQRSSQDLCFNMYGLQSRLSRAEIYKIKN